MILAFLAGCQTPTPVQPPPGPAYAQAEVRPEGFEFPTPTSVGVLSPKMSFEFTDRSTVREAAAFRERKERNALNIVERFALEKGFTVLSRTLLDRVIEEHGRQVSAAFDEKTAQEVGKLAGAEYLLAATSDYTKIGFYRGAGFYTFRFVLRLLRVETGQVVCTITWTGRKHFGDTFDPDEI